MLHRCHNLPKKISVGSINKVDIYLFAWLPNTFSEFFREKFLCGINICFSTAVIREVPINWAHSRGYFLLEGVCLSEEKNYSRLGEVSQVGDLTEEEERILSFDLYRVSHLAYTLLHDNLLLPHIPSRFPFDRNCLLQL
jgi:hypothetical protein